MKKHLLRIVVLPLLFLCSFGFSQTDSTKSETVVQAQMTIMVIPRTNADEDIRTVLDQSVEKKIAVAKMKEVFYKRGYTTIDFVSRLNAAKRNKIFLSASPSDAKSMLINQTQTDLIAEVDVNIINQGGNINKAVIPVQCYDYANSLTLGQITEECSSRENDTRDMAALVMSALKDKCSQNFLNSIEDAIKDYFKNGRPLKLLIAPSSSSPINLFTRVGSQTTKQIITEWIKKHTVNGYYTVSGSSEILLDLDNVKIDYFDSSKSVHKPDAYGDELTQYLYEKGIEAISEVTNGTLFITLKSLKKP